VNNYGTIVVKQQTIEIFHCAGLDSGVAFFSDPLPSHETLVAEVHATPHSQLFCHRHQTDQLMVLRGSLDLIVLQNRQFQLIRLQDSDRTWVRIPPRIPHAAINRSGEVVTMVNAVLRHGPVDPRDYQPRPIPRALMPQWLALQKLEGANHACAGAPAHPTAGLG
tara:strand:+ start:271 stop:765 length:495 start_codon:yes stop_codon:yes gene_type:complete